MSRGGWQWVAESQAGASIYVWRVTLAFILMAYGFAASALPVWAVLRRVITKRVHQGGAIFSLAAEF